MRCAKCHGSGNSINPKHTCPADLWMVCPVCDGAGDVPRYEECEACDGMGTLSQQWAKKNPRAIHSRVFRVGLRDRGIIYYNEQFQGLEFKLIGGPCSECKGTGKKVTL